MRQPVVRQMVVMVIVVDILLEDIVDEIQSVDGLQGGIVHAFRRL